MVFEIKSNDTQNKRQGRAAFCDAEMRSLEAKRKISALSGPTHEQAIADVKAIATKQLGFKVVKTYNSSNQYDTARTQLPGMGPGTAVVYRFDPVHNRRGFTKNDAVALEASLTSNPLLAGVSINVGHNPQTPRCIIHVGL